MSKQPYRVAIVGLGSIARAHLRGYRLAQNEGRGEGVAGADVSAEARDRFASEAGIDPQHTYASFDDLLQRERPDVVSICTWPPLHPELTEAAAGAGVKAVLTEKPMAVDLPGCDRMIAACEGA